MTNEPPTGHDVRPHGRLLPADTILWRVHRTGREPERFKPYQAGIATGRFDGQDEDPYGSLYVAFDEVTAVLEVVFRSVPVGDRLGRIAPLASIRNRSLSAVRTTTELRLIDLSTAKGLSAVGQDEWLIYCHESEFAKTRRWARWMRTQDEKAAGIIWTTRRNLVEQSLMLFADRTPWLAPAGLPSIRLDSEEGRDRVNAMLRIFNASLEGGT